MEKDPQSTAPRATGPAKVSRRKLFALGAVVAPMVVTLPIHSARGNGGGTACRASIYSDPTFQYSCVNGVVTKKKKGYGKLWKTDD
jgi:hypothetical protein